MKSFSLTKKERILERADFIDIRNRGHRLRTENFTVIARPNSSNTTRLGITVSKRFGNAVKRNRVKRLIREFFRLYKHSIPVGYDVVIIPQRKTESLSFSKVCDELGNVLIKHDAFIS